MTAGRVLIRGAPVKQAAHEAQAASLADERVRGPAASGRGHGALVERPGVDFAPPQQVLDEGAAGQLGRRRRERPEVWRRSDIAVPIKFVNSEK